MKYRTRKGIVLTSVGGQQVLVSAASLHDEIPYVTNVNDTAAFCWEVMAEGATEDELVDRVTEEFDVHDPELVRSDISGMVRQLYEKGYIITV